MSELQTTPRLSLFQIEAELLGLIDAREDALERMAAMSPDELTASPEIGEEIAACEMLIKQYLKAEVRKVDNIAYAVKEFEARSAARAEEAAKMKAQADRDAETAKRIKSMALEVMQEFGEKKLPGRLFTISRQGNGGVQALTIAQPDLVPDHLRVSTVKMCTEDFKHLSVALRSLMQCVSDDPDGARIRNVLDGGAGVPGCRLEERGFHLKIK